MYLNAAIRMLMKGYRHTVFGVRVLLMFDIQVFH